MRLDGLHQVLNRINSIEAKFATKPTVNFSQQMSEAIQKGENKSNKTSAGQVANIIQAAALRHGVKPELALAVAKAESNLSQQAVSSVGAIGVMQLMPDTAKELGVKNIFDVRDNIDGGVRYLKQMLHEFKDEKLAVAAYNAGPGAVNRYQGIPPYPETQEYVKHVFQIVNS